MKKLLQIALLLFLLLPSLTSFAQTTKPTPQLGVSTIKEVVAAMTTEEKVSLVVGTGMKMAGLPKNMQGPVVGETQNKVAGAAGTTVAIPRLGIPSIVVADGPAGLRIQPFRDNDSSRSYYCTAFPIATLLASTWDTALVKKVGAAMGNEVKEYGVDILLGPALNNHRNPLGGRNFEYYSEDPLVSGTIAAAMVNGIQSAGVGTSIKHFAANNHEFSRNTMNVVVSERALREIYLKGFQITLQKSQPWTVMSSYNKINGTYTSQSADLLTTVLRDEWGFGGFVMSDWFGGVDAVEQLKAGNDLLMPGTGKQQAAVLAAFQNKTLGEKALDKNVESILRVILLTPSFKKYRPSNQPDLKAHALITRAAAADGMVLVKNSQHSLPFAQTIKKVAVFGNASYDMVTGGTGSGDVNEAYTVPLTEGLQSAGYTFNESVKATYTSFLLEQKAKRPKGNPFFLPPPIAEMVMDKEAIEKMAAGYDIAVVTIGRNSGEFADRKLEGDFTFSDTEKELIKNVSEAFHAKGKKAVVILNVGGVVEMKSWQDDADAILVAWQPGQEAGNAVADVLSGKVSPSGKLATTFPAVYNDVPAAKNFPGKVLEPADTSNHSLGAGPKASEVVYEEGIYTGYRYFAKQYGTPGAPVYPFGYGLSYTSFSYGNFRLSSPNFTGSITISIDVTNTGSVAGKEVVQVYLHAPGKKTDVPEIELKGFGKTGLLAPGKKQTLVFTLDAPALASYDAGRESWVADPGTYSVRVGASSADIKEQGSFTLSKEIVTEKDHKVLVPRVVGMH